MPKSRRSVSLTREEIVEEALRIIRTDGVASLTMRAVATGLGVTPMAAYYYVKDKDDLLRLVSERIAESSGVLRVQSGREWQDVLKEHLLALWENSTRYPGLGGYLINQRNLGMTGERMEMGIRFFEDVGFPPHEARLAWSFAMTYIHGRISVDAHLAHKTDAPRLHGLGAGDYVRFGLDRVAAGLTSMLDSSDERSAVAGRGSRPTTLRAVKGGRAKRG
jgi:AcrR family transcriptional regulator